MFWICANEVSWLKYGAHKRGTHGGNVRTQKNVSNVCLQTKKKTNKQTNFAADIFDGKVFDQTTTKLRNDQYTLFIIKSEMWYASRSKWFTPNNENFIIYILDSWAVLCVLAMDIGRVSTFEKCRPVTNMT